jgi:hypothetical protein
VVLKVSRGVERFAGEVSRLLSHLVDLSLQVVEFRAFAACQLSLEAFPVLFVGF